jgi:hypothetical protein
MLEISALKCFYFLKFLYTEVKSIRTSICDMWTSIGKHTLMSFSLKSAKKKPPSGKIDELSEREFPPLHNRDST